MDILKTLIKRLHGELKNEWVKAYCPMHEMPDYQNHTPSLLIRADLTTCKCTSKGCISGDVNNLLAYLGMPLIERTQPDLFDREKLSRWQERFKTEAPDTLGIGWNRELCIHLGVGWTGQAFCIPVYNKNSLIQVWKYYPGKAHDRYKSAVATSDGNALFPDESVRGLFRNQTVWVTDNYHDTIAIISAGGAAVTAGGKNRWEEKHITDILHLQPAQVIVVSRNDKASEAFSSHIHKLFGIKSSVLTIHPGVGYHSITDALKAGKTLEEIELNVKVNEPFKEIPDLPEQIELVNLHSRVNSLAEVLVTVRGKYSSPYFIPGQFRIECPESSDKVCPMCPYHDGYMLKVPVAEYPSLVGVPIEKMESRLKRIANPPARCPKMTPVINKEDILTLEECRVRPPYDTQVVEEANIERRAFVIGTGLIPNDTYKLTGLVVPHSETQEICLVATERETSSVTIREDNICPEGIPSIVDMLNDISYNVTHIYDRDILHLWALITLMSPMNVNLNGVKMRTYMETFLLGDTQTGKSQTVEAVFKHFGVGRKIDSAQATVAGVLGGVSETDKGRKFVTPGIMAEMDGRIVLFEELGNLADNIMKSMREARSSGVIEIGKIEKASYAARTRIIATANPASGKRTIASYNHGCEAMFSILSDPADMRRFDILHIVQADSDVSIYRKEEVVEHKYTQTIARKHLAWAWGLTEDKVIFEEGFPQALQKEAMSLGSLGHESLPIITPANAQEKLLKVSCGLAALAGGCTEDRKGLFVTRKSLDLASGLIRTEYGVKPNGYFGYASERQAEEIIGDDSVILSRFKQLDQPRETALMLRNSITFSSLSDLQFSLALSNDIIAVKNLMAALLQQNCIKRINKMVVKTPAFVDWLKNNMENLPAIKAERKL